MLDYSMEPAATDGERYGFAVPLKQSTANSSAYKQIALVEAVGMAPLARMSCSSVSASAAQSTSSSSPLHRVSVSRVRPTSIHRSLIGSMSPIPGLCNSSGVRQYRRQPKDTAAVPVTPAYMADKPRGQCNSMSVKSGRSVAGSVRLGRNSSNNDGVAALPLDECLEPVPMSGRCRPTSQMDVLQCYAYATPRSRCCGTFSKFELLLLSGCLLFLTGFVFVSVFWLVLLEGYRIFIDGLPHYNELRTMLPTRIGPDREAGRPHAKVCTNRQCTSMAALFLANMDETRDPCDDFYEFACGNYEQERVLPPDKGIRDTLGDIESRLDRRLKSILSTEVEEDEPVWEQIAKQVYQRCINDSRISELELPAAKRLLERAGGWPVLEGPSWTPPANESWERTVARTMRQFGAKHILLSLSLSQDERNISRNLLQVDSGPLSMSSNKWLFLEEGRDAREALDSLVDMLTDVALAFGADASTARPEMQSVAEFELQLLNATAPDDELRDSNATYNPYSVVELEHMYPEIDLRSLLEVSLDGLLNVTDEFTVVISDTHYVGRLADVVSSVSVRTLHNFIKYRMLVNLYVLLPSPVREPFARFGAQITGRPHKQENRLDECIHFDRTVFYMPVGSIYVRHFFNKKTKNQMSEVAQLLKDSFIERLHNLDWMDNYTLAEALDKAHALSYKLAYPAWMLNASRMHQDWGNTSLADSEALVDTYTRCLVKSNRLEFGSLHKPPDRNMWYESPAQVDAYYAPNWNQMIFPAGVMQYPLLAQDVPAIVTFGMIGAVAGHEVSHAFDDTGSHYDAEGNLRNWWDEHTRHEFVRKAQCFVNQYNNVQVKAQAGLTLNGRSTLGENIADNAGVKTAYMALQTWLRRHGPPQRLPGLHSYSNDQLFFIAYANMYCTLMLPSEYEHYIRSDPHSPNRFRATLPLRNVPEFAAAFKCPKGSPMNPVDKCSMW